MAGKQIVDPGWGYEKEFGYSQGVRAGGLVTFAGQMPVDAQCNLVGEGDPPAQTGRSLRTSRPCSKRPA